MRLRTVFNVHQAQLERGGTALAPLPLDYDRPGHRFLLEQGSGDALVARLDLDLPTGQPLRVRAPQASSDPALRRIVVDELQRANEIVADMLVMISFVFAVELHNRGRSQTVLEPDTDAEAATLARIGSNKVHEDFVVDWQERSFELYEVGDPAIDKLLTRRVGMHLYYEALQLERPIARFRELWRVLESAFGTTNDRLINRLADFQTSKELEFTKGELKGLLILRGRASHSSSRAGLKELREVTLQVRQRLGRLRCLAEQVILTKKHWGKDSLEVERLGPLSAYVAPDNSLALLNHGVREIRARRGDDA